MNDKLYTEDSIQSLDPREFTRLRPGVYCGSTEYSTQLLVEIISNAIDEFKAGHGNLIEVKIDTKENSYAVRDYAQGFLVNSMREDGKTILQASFDTLNTSGKFSDDGVYEGTALGLNGIGSKLTNFLSHKMEVETWRDGQTESIFFNEGIFVNRSVGKSKEPNGTYVRWQPSEEFFTHPEVDINKVKELFHILTCLCVGLTIELTIDDKKEIFTSKHGLNDLVDDAVGDSEIINSRMNMNFDAGRNKLDMVVTYTSKYSLNMISYVNTGDTDAGPHITQIKTILTREFNKFFKEKKWLKEKDENLSGDDIQEGMFIAFNLTAPGVSYDAQTKSRIVKIDMSPFTTSIVNALHDWFNKNEKDIKIIFEKAAAARKARDAAKKARDKAREQNKKKQKALKFDSKLADCNSKDRSKCEIYITEGDSASGNLKLARDNETQAVMPVRGKILNTQKATFAQIQKNAEIMTMCDAFFGPGDWSIDPKTLKVTYHQVRYGKIIIMSDADVSNTAYERLFA
jgi:DNA gyrase/topoisomerase IV subunit B